LKGVIMSNSSGTFIDVINELGFSGIFLTLARNEQLVPASKAILERERIAKELSEVEDQLRACNNPVSLSELATWCAKGKRDFKSRLTQKAAKLEARKLQLSAKLQQIDQQLAQIDSSFEWTWDPSPMTSLVPRVARKTDPCVAERNEIIDANVDFTTQEICVALDRNFTRDGAVPCDQFPMGWFHDYGVATFREAYRHPECRSLVHKMISVRRSRRGYLKT
jgi:hypothetical protein